jgi:hypothetical protein
MGSLTEGDIVLPKIATALVTLYANRRRRD